MTGSDYWNEEMTRAIEMPPGIDETDMEALRLAFARSYASSKAQADQLDWMAKDQGWLKAAMFAASCCQRDSLHLKPWQSPPCRRERAEDRRGGRGTIAPPDAEGGDIRVPPGPAGGPGKGEMTAREQHRRHRVVLMLAQDQARRDPPPVTLPGRPAAPSSAAPPLPLQPLPIPPRHSAAEGAASGNLSRTTASGRGVRWTRGSA
jgi:hypothetical protein